MGLILPAFTFRAIWVGADQKLDEYDRVFANVVLSESEASFRVSFHAPTGTVKKGSQYNGGEGVWVKGVSDNRLQIVFGKKDPAEGVNYANAGEVNELPF
jgi:hypothetical protein